jgi:hypothetical protein
MFRSYRPSSSDLAWSIMCCEFNNKKKHLYFYFKHHSKMHATRLADQLIEVSFIHCDSICWSRQKTFNFTVFCCVRRGKMSIINISRKPFLLKNRKRKLVSESTKLYSTVFCCNPSTNIFYFPSYFSFLPTADEFMWYLSVPQISHENPHYFITFYITNHKHQ